jgi:hypothetical protein
MVEIARLNASRAHFGVGLERIGPPLEGRYRTVPVLGDPLLWRLEALSKAASPSAP